MENRSVKNNLLQEDLDFFSSQMSLHLKKIEEGFSLKKNDTNLISHVLKNNLLQIFQSSLHSKAKRVRPLLCYWMMRFFQEQSQIDLELVKEKTTIIALSMEILHNASLIIDDIEDGSIERRSNKTIHLLYGIPHSLNTASWMYFLALDLLPNSLHKVCSSALLDCHMGQALDIGSNEDGFIEKIFHLDAELRWQYYSKCVELKTTRLFILSLECMKQELNLSSEQYSPIEKIIYQFGMTYQMFDDLKNLFSEFSGHKTNEDLQGGFRSSISIEFLNLLTENELKNAYLHYQSQSFFQFMTTNLKFEQAKINCFRKAETSLGEVSSALDQILGSGSELRNYISQIIELPFFEVRKSIEKCLYTNCNQIGNEIQNSLLTERASYL